MDYCIKNLIELVIGKEIRDEGDHNINRAIFTDGPGGGYTAAGVMCFLMNVFLFEIPAITQG
ncbi:hypothetical protein D3C73_1405320 [compost metagenome]